MAEKNRPKPKVCRNLMLEFAEAEDDQEEGGLQRLREEQRRSAVFENEINKLLSTSLSSKIRKWNYDFVNDTPLEGDWKWNFDSDGRKHREKSDGEEDDARSPRDE